MIVIPCAAASCGGTTYFLDEQELARFEAAGPVMPEVDTKRILSGMLKPGPYRVVPGDLLEIKGPRALFLGAGDPGTGRVEEGEHLTRVDAEGAIWLPVVGKFEAQGLSLSEIEERISKAVFPKFLRRRPSIVVDVVDYRKTRVTVVGAVEKPGLVKLRSDELSLYGALSACGGILKASNLVVGARLIRIRRPGETRPQALVLPVKGLNVPVGDVALEGGETIEVERYEPDTFTVIGLVQKPGAHEYPPEVTYNLMQALAIAGGVDMTADPPYATVFRKDKDGKILPATFAISGVGLAQASALEIKPGDVIVVEHTAASWTRSLLAQILRIQLGFFIDRNTFD